MRRSILVIVVVTAAALLWPGGVLAATLRLASTQPLVVRGSGFRAHELVRVTLARAAGPRVRTVRATAEGRLRVRFHLALDECPGWKLVARGNHGSRAYLRSNLHVDCAAP